MPKYLSTNVVKYLMGFRHFIFSLDSTKDVDYFWGGCPRVSFESELLGFDLPIFGTFVEI